MQMERYITSSARCIALLYRVNTRGKDCMIYTEYINGNGVLAF